MTTASVQRGPAAPGATQPPRASYVPDGVRAFRGGSGDPLLAIHKMGSSWWDWKPVLPAFTAERDVLAPNLAGHRNANQFPPGRVGRPSAFADDVERWLDAAGWERPDIVAASFGGWVALELARRGRARSVVGIAPGGGWSPEEARRLERDSRRLHTLARATLPLARLIARAPAGRRALFAADFASPDRMSSEEARHALMAFAGTRELPRILDGIRGPNEHFPNPDGLEEIVCPVLFIWGTEDRRVPLAQSRHFLDRIQHAQLVELPGVGHGAMTDDPDAVSRLTLEFARE
jgi:pimeloyl-ACP methyl ester carboxylesterase